MADNTDKQEKRIKPRVAWSFMVKYRPSNDERWLAWEVSCIQNISESGCSFSSRFAFEPQSSLDIEIQFPALTEPMRFMGNVKRCDQKGKLYFIGVEFAAMDEEKKNTFLQTLNFFLNKKR